MPKMQKMGGMASHLDNENMKHKAVVEKVYDKWLGDGYADRCGEGIATHKAIDACSYLNAAAEAVSPKGAMLGTPMKELSDRNKGGTSGGPADSMKSSRKMK